ncbi:MAG: hypothetical protein GX890_00920 [Firmicutes bacterium]|jgi:YteA family regulatory protein|nr:hypothetical protein [Bacillota bacterium]HPU01066.1 TraR/DksA C4-type zinc finger protein [Bacillota bacterium]
MAGKWEKHAAALREKRRQLLEQLGEGPSREHGLGMRDSVAELSFADNHPADLGTENFERSKDLSLRELHFSQLRQVEEALARISAGTYGICSRCGEKIPEARLEAVPEASLCLPCREYEERAAAEAGRRPVEEELLRRPFTRTAFFGDPGFDSEDFWQEAARHNKRPRVYDDALEDEETGLVEEIDRLTNEDYRSQLPD